MEMMVEGRCRSQQQGLSRRKLSSCVYLVTVSWWCTAVLPMCATAFQPQQMFLNSLANCGHGDSRPPWHKVDQGSLYRVRDDVSPGTRTATFLTCHMIFRSTQLDGRLCLYQRHLEFDNNNVELHLYDGHVGADGKEYPDEVVNVDKDLLNSEWCSTGRFLTIEMVKRAKAASVKDVVIDLMIYHISSVHRKAFLDTSPSCGSVLALDHSRVNVTNRDLSLREEDLHTKCSLQFTYEGHEENRSLCMVFQPAPPPCSINYTLKVFSFVPAQDDPARLQKVLSQEGSCHKPLAERWCSNSTKLILHLDRPVVELSEDVLFHALIIDHHGDPKTLPSLFNQSKAAPASQHTVIIIVASVLGIVCLLTVIAIIIVIWRRQRSKKRPRLKAKGEACNHMLSGREEAVRNGGNHYTDGTHPENV